MTPRNAGMACSEPSLNGCTGTQGSCDAFGKCVRPAQTGKACLPERPEPCRSQEAGTCDAAGECIANNLTPGMACRPEGATDLCQTYNCRFPQGSDKLSCTFNGSVTCPRPPSGCEGGTCNPATGLCRYGPYSAGTRVCENDAGMTQECCPGMVCAQPPGCGTFGCVLKYCYYNN